MAVGTAPKRTATQASSGLKPMKVHAIPIHNGKPTSLANDEKTNKRGDDLSTLNRKLAPTASSTNGKVARAKIPVISVSKNTYLPISVILTNAPAAIDKIRGFLKSSLTNKLDKDLLLLLLCKLTMVMTNTTFTMGINMAAPSVANISPSSPYIELANANAIKELNLILACNIDVPVGLSTRLKILIIKAKTETENRAKPNIKV